jgi:dolichol kinase
MATSRKTPVKPKSTVKETVETATEAVKLPVSFNQFRKYPVAAVAFLCIIGMIYLYKDKQKSEVKGIDNCLEQTMKLEKKIDFKDSIILNLITQQAIINATN